MKKYRIKVVIVGMFRMNVSIINLVMLMCQDGATINIPYKGVVVFDILRAFNKLSLLRYILFV